MRNAKEEVLEMLRDMNDSDLVAVHNEYCDKVRYYDDRIYDMYEINDLLYGRSPLEIITDARDVDANDNYIRYNGYGNLESTDCPDDWMDLDEIADYIVENDDALRNDDIRDLLDEIEAENEEEEEEEEEDEE